MNDLIRSMESLKQSMEVVSRQMKQESIGKNKHIENHAMELLGASTTLQTWIDGIKKEQSK